MRGRTCFRSVLKYIKGPIQRLATAFAVLAIIAAPSLLITNSAPAESTLSSVTINYSVPFVPQQYFRPWDQNFNFSVLIDVHRHPNWIDPDTLLQWHIAAGYNAVVMTEHNLLSTSIEVQKVARAKYNDKIKVIVGEEWTNCRMHMGMIGLKEYIDVPKNPTDEQIQDVIKQVHAQGGLVVVNHIPWSIWAGLDEPNSDDLIKWGADFFDVTTYERLDLQTIYYANSKNVSVVAGTDSHELGLAHAWTLLDVDPNNITEDSIMDALRSKKTSFIFDETGYQPPILTEATTNSMYTFLFPWIIIGNFFHSFYDKYHGTYSFVDGYCGMGEKYVVRNAEIFTSVAWMVFVWMVLELGWAGLLAAYERIALKINPHRRRRGHSGDSDGAPLMDLWDR